MLEIVPIHAGARRRAVERLAERLSRSPGRETIVTEPWFDPEVAFDVSRGQYNSTVLLRLLIRPTTETVLGVAGVDLFIPVLSYVFGEAQVGGTAAVVSVARLRPEVYGLPADEGLLLDRLEKEAVHELGHAAGLLHCRSPFCVMHSSTYVEEIDLKPVTYCEACRRLAPGRPALPPV